MSVFINYRAEDSLTTAALIDHKLTARFGHDNVFLDCRSIPAGADSADEITRWLRRASVLLVVIGPRWLATINKDGSRRIDDPHDWIRMEIKAAFGQGTPVVPVLLEQAQLPTEKELPPDIAALSRRQCIPLRLRHTTLDLTYLIDCIVNVNPDLANLP